MKNIIIEALEGLKGKSISVIDVNGLTSITDTLIIASGTSSRHVKALAASVVTEGKKKGHQPLGVEGDDVGEWVLVDYGDVILHVMLPATREFYDLERLWAVSSDQEKSD